MLNQENTVVNLMPYFDRDGVKSKLVKRIGEGVPCHLHIEGKAGMGKSRLMSEVVHDISRKQTVYGYVSPPQAVKINNFLQDVLVNLTSMIKLDDFLTDVYDDKREEYSSIVSCISETGEIPQGYTNLMIENLICDFLGYVSKVKDVVFIVEDIHWRDEGRDSLLKKILSFLERKDIENLCLITTSREPSVYKHLAITQNVELASLTPSDTERLIQSCFVDRYSIDDYVDDLASFSEGNPYFISETLNLIDKEGRLENRSEGVPKSFQDIFQRQLNELNSVEESILRVASVIGLRVRYEEIVFLLPELSAFIDRALEKLAVSGHLIKIYGFDRVYEFHHIIKKDGIYNLTDRENRIAWHYALYRYYRSQKVKALKNKYELCAYHAYESGAYKEAASFFWYCGKKSLTASEPEKAITFFLKFLKCAEIINNVSPNILIRVHLECCRSLLMNGKVKIAQNHLGVAENMIADTNLSHDDKFKWQDEISILEVLLLWLDGAFNKQDLIRLRQKFSGKNDTHITNQIRLSLMMIDIGEYKEASDFFENFIANSRKRNNYKNSGLIWSIEMICYSALANCYAGLNEKEQALENVEKAIELVGKCEHPPQKMYGLTFGAKALQKIGEYKKAGPLINESHEITKNYPVGIIQPIVSVEYARYLNYSGDPLGALAQLDECLNFVISSSFSHPKLIIKKCMADIYFDLGFSKVALDLLYEAKKLAHHIKNFQAVTEITALINKNKNSF